MAGGKHRESASGGLTLEAISGRLQELEELVRIQAAKDGPNGGRETAIDDLGERGGLGMLGSDESEQKKRGWGGGGGDENIRQPGKSPLVLPPLSLLGVTSYELLRGEQK